MTAPAASREPLTDSPWFWVYLFATTALILLVVFRPKLESRQASIERQHQAREMAWPDNQAADAEHKPVAATGDTVVGLRYLYWVLGLLVLLGWVRLWYVRYRPTGFRKQNTDPRS